MTQAKKAETLKPVDSLPDELKKQLSARYLKGGDINSSQIGAKVLKVLQAANAELSLDAILVAHYKAAGEVLTRGSVQQALRSLVTQNKVSKPTVGLYGLPKDDEQAAEA